MSANPGTALPERFFVRTLTPNDVEKLLGNMTGTFETDLGKTARDTYPTFWGWPDNYEQVVRRRAREEWKANGRLFSSATPPQGRAGYLQLRRRPAVNGYTNLRFDYSAAEALLDRISGRMKRSSKSHVHETVDFNEACRLVKPFGITVADFIKAMADGHLIPCIEQQNIRGLLRFVFLIRSLFNYGKHYQLRTGRVDGYRNADA